METCLLRALHIEEALFGHDEFPLIPSLANLGTLYDKWGKPDQSEPLYR
jgi:hypothetical protein